MAYFLLFLTSGLLVYIAIKPQQYVLVFQGSRTSLATTWVLKLRYAKYLQQEPTRSLFVIVLFLCWGVVGPGKSADDDSMSELSKS